VDILFGSNSVDTKNVKRDEQSRHHCLGEMYGLTTISAQNIAYAAVVVSNAPNIEPASTLINRPDSVYHQNECGV
jgi:hypothetical protein